jgi:hypothetical protein
MGGGKRAEVLDELGASHDPQGATVRRALDHHDFERREDRRELLHGRQVGVGAADQPERRHLDRRHIFGRESLLTPTAYQGCHREAIITTKRLL